VRIRRQVSYQWRLREVMAQRGLFATTELVPLLAERGITLSASQVHRLVTGIPERLSLPVLAALCDILECTPTELIATRAANAAPRKTGTSDAAAVAELPVDLRPRRARLRPQ
jgi:DNA-binding Xre family transcriptional regulator